MVLCNTAVGKEVMCGVMTEPGRQCAEHYEGENLVFPVEMFARHD
jgi:hypothetical protein